MSEWIKVTQTKLPRGVDHLLFVDPPDGLQPIMVVGYFNKLTQTYFIGGESYPYINVTHYMPLPDGPESKS